MNIREIANIANKAEDLLKAAKIKNMFPVPLERIAEHCKYEIKKFTPNKKTEKISGALFRNENLILVNGGDSYLRQRFTIAHEFGHHTLHSNDPDFIDHRKVDITDGKEAEANEFAASLLMPEKEFMKKHKEFDGNCEMLSEYFGTSVPSIGVRISKLGLDR